MFLRGSLDGTWYSFSKHGFCLETLCCRVPYRPGSTERTNHGRDDVPLRKSTVLGRGGEFLNGDLDLGFYIVDVLLECPIIYMNDVPLQLWSCG